MSEVAKVLKSLWKAAPGQLWHISSKTTPGAYHRLYVGDNTEPFGIEDEKPGAVVTDPPYGIDWDADYTRFTHPDMYTFRSTNAPIKNDDKPFDPARWLTYPEVILWGCNAYFHRLAPGSVLIWDKRIRKEKKFLADAEAAYLNKG